MKKLLKKKKKSKMKIEPKNLNKEEKMKKILILSLLLIFFFSETISQEKKSEILVFKTSFEFAKDGMKEYFIKNCQLKNCRVASVGIFWDYPTLGELLAEAFSQTLGKFYVQNNWNDFKLEGIEIKVMEPEMKKTQVIIVGYGGKGEKENQVVYQDLERFIKAVNKLLWKISLELFSHGYSRFEILQISANGLKKTLGIKIRAYRRKPKEKPKFPEAVSLPLFLKHNIFFGSLVIVNIIN